MNKESSLCIGCHNGFGNKNPNWNGGKTRHKKGYVLVYSSKHPRAHRNGGYVFEHILVMEDSLNRFLYDNETVHHKNGVRDDNSIENLELWTKPHPSGVRVEDIVKYSVEVLNRYAPGKFNKEIQMKFKVTVPGTRNYFNVFVEDSNEKMLNAKSKFKGLEKDDEKAGAFICPFEKFTVSKKTGEQVRSPLIGHIYFSKENLKPAVVAHELVHAAIYADRLLFDNKRAMFGMKISDKEERMTHNFSDMLDNLMLQMHNGGAI